MESLIEAIQRGASLTGCQIEDAVAALIDPAGDETQKAEFLKAWAVRGETSDEIAALVQALLARAVRP